MEGKWTTAFNRFREARRNAGVQAQRIQRPVDNEKYVVIDLDFETVDKAQTFLGFLRNTIWTSAANSPGLAGTPEALVLEAASVDCRSAGAQVSSRQRTWTGPAYRVSRISEAAAAAA